MIAAFSTPYNRTRTFILLTVCGLLAIAAAAVGIDDNPPAAGPHRWAARSDISPGRSLTGEILR